MNVDYHPPPAPLEVSAYTLNENYLIEAVIHMKVRLTSGS